MRVLFTGASSTIGSRVLEEMLKSGSYAKIWCARHKHELQISDPRLGVIDLDLTSDRGLQTIPQSIDVVLHFAAVTHSHDPDRYWEVNHQGTVRLAEAARAQGCRRFVYISTRCATVDAGAYGESKLAAEDELNKLDWESLLIIRPSEIYGAGGTSGIDRLISLSQHWHITPVLFGSSKIEFAPLHIDDFVSTATEAIATAKSDHVVIEVCGPEDLSGPALGWRLAKHFRTFPIPVWWPLVALLMKSGINLGVRDQAQRLTCMKTSSAKSANAIGKIRFLEVSPR